MCGISGFYSPRGHFSAEVGHRIGVAMAAAIERRGPDDAGCWVDAEQGIALSHRRLAIVDLSPAGAQPMQSASGRYSIVYNGEIYNHLEVRNLLVAAGAATSWRGHSDTETLLAAIDCWGLEGALGRLTGMFALALWDRAERRLSIARDRLGEKPLYYGWQGEGSARTLMFASELAALRVHPAFRADLDREALAAYLRFGYVPTPRSIFHNVSKLEAGTIMSWTGGEETGRSSVYWSAAEVARAGRANRFAGSPAEAADEVERLLTRSVSRQMLADVPLGAFLSGGIDSSTVVALMRTVSSQPVRTFTIGFEANEYNEANDAAAVARHLGTDHTELYVSPEEALAVIPQLPEIYSEPFADSSQVPTFLVSKLARRSVTVALSGDGGDEVFGGYNRYLFTKKMWGFISKLPRSFRTAGAGALTSVSPAAWEAIGDRLAGGRVRLLGDKVHKGAGLLNSRTVGDVYSKLVMNPGVDGLLLDDPFVNSVADAAKPEEGLTDIERMMLWDTLQYMPDDILVKVDRAAMAVSLETRVPLLDHDLLAFAWTLDESVRIHNGRTKWPLREVLSRHVPSALIDRPKMGFGAPIGEWLRGPLREWAADLLSQEKLRSDGLFDLAGVQRRWDEHQSGKRNWAPQLWALLMFQAWSQRHLGADEAPIDVRHLAVNYG